MQRIAIIEPSHSHEEVILPQIELLHGHYDIHVVAPQSLLDVELLRDTKKLYQACPFATASVKGRLRRLLSLPFKYLAIRRIVRPIEPHVIIFNSTYSLVDVVLIVLIFRAYKKIQIIHNFEQFLSPFGYWLYRRFSANLVISEEVCKYVTSSHPAYSDLDYFLPIFFDSFLAIHGRTPDSQELSTLKLGVFGSIEDSRRNYSGILESVRNIVQTQPAVGFRLYLVGKAPSAVQDFIRTHHLESVIEFYPAFVPFHMMFSLLNDMDIVLFLIDHQVTYAEQYNRYKISGTSTLMKAFKKAGCTSTDFHVDDSLAAKCFTYPGTDIGRFLEQISEGRITRCLLQEKAAAYADDEQFSFQRQKTRFLSVIHGVQPENG